MEYGVTATTTCFNECYPWDTRNSADVCECLTPTDEVISVSSTDNNAYECHPKCTDANEERVPHSTDC